MRRVGATALVIGFVGLATACVPVENTKPDDTGIKVRNRTDVTLVIEFEAVPFNRLQGEPLRVDRTEVDPLGELGAGQDAVFRPSAFDERGTMADTVVRTTDGDEVVRLGRGLLWEGVLAVEVRPEDLP
jgi:hypothetical protein